MKRPSPQRYERYSFDKSPWVQNLTQRELAGLLGYGKDHLEALIRDKEQWISRRTEVIGGKQRQLAIPVGRLRAVHDRLKFHFNKVKQPDYLFSPRKGRGQRDNAQRHAGQTQLLSLDVRQFYPKTTSEDIFRWAHHVAGLRSDVAGMLVHLVAIDGRMPFGSPVSPVLITLVHRAMFDRIALLCELHELSMSLWVDDITISGREVPSALLEQTIAAIREGGFQTHKVRFRTTNRPAIITGVPIEGGRVTAPQSVHERIRLGYASLRVATSDADRVQETDRLLSALGTLRHFYGRTSREGRLASDRMAALRQRRGTCKLTAVTPPSAVAPMQDRSTTDADAAPWE